MSLRADLEQIPLVNDHTHIFGTGEVDDYEAPGRWAQSLTGSSLIASLSGMGMNETATMRLLEHPEALRELLLRLYEGRRFTYPVRAAMRFLRDRFGIEEEITPENADAAAERIGSSVPAGTDALYGYLASLTNVEVWFCNHGNVARPDRCCAGTTRGKFRWVPYMFSDAGSLNTVAEAQGLDRPATESDAYAVLYGALKTVRGLGAVAIKGGAFAYALSRPFAPEITNLARLAEAKERIDRGVAQPGDHVALTDALTLLYCRAAGEVGLPVQIHVGLIWSASGPTRIPEITELTPLFHACPGTTFVVFHGGYPRWDDLAHVAATMSNVRPEFNWVPFWAGASFPELLGRWIDMVPADRVLYGSDAGSYVTSVHDTVTRQALAEALEARIKRGLYSKSMALELATAMLRNNAISTYGLDLQLL